MPVEAGEFVCVGAGQRSAEKVRTRAKAVGPERRIKEERRMDLGVDQQPEDGAQIARTREEGER